MITILNLTLGALFFAVAGCLGALLGSMFADRLSRFDDAPPPLRAPVAALITACAVLGAFVVLHAHSQVQVLLLALVCAALVALWITDSRCGIVPDAFTLGPLAVVVVGALWRHEWWLMVSVAVPLVPFAVAAFLSKGRGMGWGDVKLVALGGAVLGPQTRCAGVRRRVLGRRRRELRARAPQGHDRVRTVSRSGYRRGHSDWDVAVSSALLRNSTTGEIIAGNVHYADSWWERLAGFIPRRSVDPDEGLWFRDCWAIHTLGMRSHIDVIFLDRWDCVIRTRRAVPHRPIISCMGARSVVELGAGALDGRDLLAGDKLVLQ